MSATSAEPVAVVGVGASAGGLEAYTQLISQLPADTGMAYVLVQHLAPEHKSLLAELLARDARIPVIQVTDGMLVEPDHAYVIPPNTTMALAGDRLHLAPRERTKHAPKPINEFFRSLAESRGSRSIGVVLSGADSDGEQGVKTIKAAGGLILAEDPQSAQYDSMPRSAIATGCVDFILPPVEIAAQLARIGRHPYVCQAEAEQAEEGSAAGARNIRMPPDIFRLLRRSSGVDFSQYKQGTLTRRVRRRMLLNRVDTLDEYVALLERDPKEIETLRHDLLICVTSFFRDTAAFEALVQVGLPRMLQSRKPGMPVRVWVPGCATGEEAYSIAICLLECLGDEAKSSPPQIFATDVSEDAIATARAGSYPEAIEEDVSPERLRRFFVKEHNGYRVGEDVRDVCVFAVQNVTSDPPFSRVDIVSCRNVLIYLQPALQTKVLALFHYALSATGILFLGTAESVGPSPDYFAPLDKKHRVYVRTASPRHAPQLGAPRARGALEPEAGQAAGTQREPRVLDLEREADQIVLAHYDSAGVVIDGNLDIVQFRGATNVYLGPAPGAASFHLLAMVRPELRAALHDAIRTARRGAAPSHAAGVAVLDGSGAPLSVDLTVLPFKVVDSPEQYFVVLFEPAASPSAAGAPSSHARRAGDVGVPRATARRETRTVGQLRQELAAMERHRRALAEEHATALEELRAANEEIQSSNEELRSTNEEIETAKEELQSANEELNTLNTELRDRNTDLGVLNDDLTNLFTSIQVPLLIVGRDLRIRRFTAGAERLVNVIPTDVGRPLADITPRIDIPDLAEQAREVMDTFAVVEREVRDDRGRWYTMRIRPYKTAGQNIDGAVLIFHDIDERKRHAEALESARRYAQAIVDTVREPLVVLDDELRIDSANRAFYETFYVDPSHTEGRSLFELGEGQWDIPRLRTLLEEVLPRQSSVTDFEVEHTFPTIGHRIMRLNGRELLINDGADSGHVRRILLAIEDVTRERRMAQREHILADMGSAFGSSADHHGVLATIAQLAVPALADWCIVDVRDAGGSLRRASVAGADPDRADRARSLIVDAAAVPEHSIARVLRTGVPLVVSAASASMVESILGKGGEAGRDREPTPRSLAIVPLKVGDRVLGALTLLATATSERRFTPVDIMLAEEFARRAALALENAALYEDAVSARAAAQQANQAKTLFLATMSHELRTPLNAILGFTQLLDMDLHGSLSDTQRDYVRRIKNAQQHLRELVDDVLQFAKIEAGQATMYIVDVPAEAVLSDIDGLIAAQMRARQLDYSYNSSDPTVIVRADAMKVRQIVLNLLSNAMKFTEPGGSVTLECEATENDVLMHVKDTGMGIPRDKFDQIFAPFVQLDTTRTRRAEGTGLGLAISRDLAHEMDGELTVTSVMGEGSTFTLTLPRGRELSSPPG